MVYYQPPQIIEIGTFKVGLNVVMMAMAFLVFLIFFALKAKREGITKQHIFNISVLIFFSGIWGSHFLRIFLRPDIIDYQKSFLEVLIEIFAVWRGKIVSYGAIIFPIIFVSAYVWKKKDLSLGKILDIMALFCPLGLALKRIGCFLQGCCFGLPTTLPWGIVYSQNSLAFFIFGSIPLHPTQIYLVLGNLLIFLILLKIEKIRKNTGFINFKGITFLFFLILYSLERFFISFLRYSPPEEPSFGIYTREQIFCIIVFIGATYFLLRKYKQKKKAVEALRL